MINPIIKQMTEEHFGAPIKYPNDCVALQLAIEQQTGETIGLNTVKRLMGFLQEEHSPRRSSLDILAHYLSCSNWNVLELIASAKGNSDFDKQLKEITPQDVALGHLLEFEYEPHRKVVLRKIDDNRFRVESSFRSKLVEGDIIDATHFVLGHPFICRVTRGGEVMPLFTAGNINGLTAIRLL